MSAKTIAMAVANVVKASHAMTPDQLRAQIVEIAQMAYQQGWQDHAAAVDNKLGQMAGKQHKSSKAA